MVTKAVALYLTENMLQSPFQISLNIKHGNETNILPNANQEDSKTGYCHIWRHLVIGIISNRVCVR